MKKTIVITLIIMLVLGIGLAAYLYLSPRSKDPKKINSFEACVEAGNLVVETQPRECHMKDGRVFFEEGNAAQLKEVIQVELPVAKQIVETPFKIQGQATSSWFYNNQLSVKLFDENGKIVSTAIVKAQAEVTKSKTMVPFLGVVHFQNAETAKGKLLIERTNPVQDEEGKNGPLIIPVRFK